MDSVIKLINTHPRTFTKAMLKMFVIAGYVVVLFWVLKGIAEKGVWG